MARSERDFVALDPAIRDFLAAVLFGRELTMVEYDRQDGTTLRLVQVQGNSGERCYVEATPVDGSGRIWIDIGLRIEEEEGSQGGEGAKRLDLDGRIRVRKMNSAPIGEDRRLEPAEKPRGFASCPEHHQLGLKMALGRIPGRICEECDLAYLSDDEYRQELEWLNKRGITTDELPY